MEIIIISGPPYCGKGTQCKLLEDKFGYKHVSTGDIIREEKEKGSLLGEKLREYDKKGELIPNDLMQVIIDYKLVELSKHKIILDGYPRTVAQSNFLVSSFMEIKMIINIYVDREELLKRAELRSKTSNREDDIPELYCKRIDIYEKETKPAVEYLGKLYPIIHVNGNNSIENVGNKLISIIGTE